MAEKKQVPIREIKGRSQVLKELRRLKKEENKEVTLDYDGGGDSGDYKVFIGEEELGYDTDNPVARHIIEKFNPHFYVNSDGYYEGESGKVTIDLEKGTLLKEGHSTYTETLSLPTINVIPPKDSEGVLGAIDRLSLEPNSTTWMVGDFSDMETGLLYKESVILSPEDFEKIKKIFLKVEKAAIEKCDTIEDAGYLDGSYLRITAIPAKSSLDIDIEYSIEVKKPEFLKIPL